MENPPRQLFGRRIGEIAVECGLAEASAISRALEAQARCLAVSLAISPAKDQAIAVPPVEAGGPWPDAALLARVLGRWEAAAAEYGAGEAHLEGARERIRRAERGLPARQAPAMGALLSAMGIAPAETVYALLAAQAAGRLLEIVENMAGVAPEYQEDPSPRILDYVRSEPQWERIAGPEEPEYLVGGQRVLFAASMLESSLRLHPPLADTAAIRRAVAALLLLALEALQDVGGRLPAIAARIAAILKERGARWKIDLPVPPVLAHTALHAVSAAMEAADISLGQRHADLQMERRRQEKAPEGE